MKVVVTDREAMNALWGTSSYGPVTRTIEISDFCPCCGERRGTPVLRPQVEGGWRWQAHQWENPCGHVDKYRALIKQAEAIAVPPSEAA